MKYKLHKPEVYITNVCNLTCNNCNRFNNHKFTGFQDWNEYAEIYQQWSQLLEVDTFVIMGGEPTLNPTLPAWILGLNNAFGVNVQVLTNGTRLDKVPELYDTLLITPRSNIKNYVGISLHNIDHFDEIRHKVKVFLRGGGIIEWGGLLEKTPSMFWKNQITDYVAIDNNQAKISMHLSNKFFQASIQPTADGRFTLFDNDPVLAHEACGFAQFKSYHFIRGKLYKCGPVALMPEFDQQHNLAISDKDREILNSYQPLTVENFESYADEFFRELDNPIPQCKFCPVAPVIETISPSRKGSL